MPNQRVPFYNLDLGRVYYLPSLNYKIVRGENNNPADVPDPQLIIPPVLWSSYTNPRLGTCELPKFITPRYVKAIFSGGDYYKIEYPYQPGTQEWFSFWDALNNLVSNGTLQEIVGVGEVVKHPVLALSL